MLLLSFIERKVTLTGKVKAAAGDASQILDVTEYAYDSNLSLTWLHLHNDPLIPWYALNLQVLHVLSRNNSPGR